MKLNGTHKFQADSTRVFNAILDPAVLKKCIPGCDSVEQMDAGRFQLAITTPLPGLKGPIGVVIDLVQHEEPHLIVLGVKRQGRGGSVDATANISIADEANGSLLTYHAQADLGGLIAIADNPIGKPFVNSTLSSIFTNLDKTLV